VVLLAKRGRSRTKKYGEGALDQKVPRCAESGSRPNARNDLAGDFLLGGALRFQHNRLEFFKDWELLVGVVDLGVSLFLRE